MFPPVIERGIREGKDTPRDYGKEGCHILVIQPRRHHSCADCDRAPLRHLVLESGAPLCLDCADLGHLVFLPRGDAALTPAGPARAVRSPPSWSASTGAAGATSVRASSSRRPPSPAAEAACLADAEARARRRARDAGRRAAEDVRFTSALTAEILRLFPCCPAERARDIAEHSSVRGSGRVGRSAAGRALDEFAVTAAVRASVRHLDTEYDALLMARVPHNRARARVAAAIDAVLASWAADGCDEVASRVAEDQPPVT